MLTTYNSQLERVIMYETSKEIWIDPSKSEGVSIVRWVNYFPVCFIQPHNKADFWGVYTRSAGKLDTNTSLFYYAHNMQDSPLFSLAIKLDSIYNFSLISWEKYAG